MCQCRRRCQLSSVFRHMVCRESILGVQGIGYYISAYIGIMDTGKLLFGVAGFWVIRVEGCVGA